MNAKYQRVASLLEDRIRTGDLPTGEKLPGEAELARELSVSRGTVRQALGELQRRRLVSTHVGVGSFVAFDGVVLDSSRGWAHALTLEGIDLSVEVLDISCIPAAEVTDAPRDLGIDEVIAVRRVRRLPDGTAVSFECSSVPARGMLRDLPRLGLVEGSLTKTLDAADLRSTRGEQNVGVVSLDEREAAILEREPGTLFLRSVRTSRSADGELVEHVVSSLDPDHFRLHMTFGEPV